jgi:hypothetical protein
MSAKNAKNIKRVGHGGGPEGSSGHWTQVITRGKPALLSGRGVRCYFVVQNHGPDTALLATENGDDFELPAGSVRATRRPAGELLA